MSESLAFDNYRLLQQALQSISNLEVEVARLTVENSKQRDRIASALEWGAANLPTIFRGKLRVLLDSFDDPVPAKTDE